MNLVGKLAAFALMCGASSCTTISHGTSAGRAPLILLGRVIDARPQKIAPGQDGIEDWSAYDFRVSARAAGETSFIGKIITFFVPGEYRDNQCPFDKSSDYLVILKATSFPKNKDKGVYYMIGCTRLDKIDNYGFIRD